MMCMASGLPRREGGERYRVYCGDAFDVDLTLALCEGLTICQRLPTPEPAAGEFSIDLCMD